MSSILAKLAALGAYVALTFSFYSPNDLTAACVASGVVLALGLVSFNWGVAVRGDGETPGIIPIFTLILLAGPFCLFHLLPIELYEFGISSKIPTNDRWDVLIILLSSVVMALYIWIPLLCYHLIDIVFRRLDRPTTQAV